MSEWETFCHGSYNLWRVRRKNERGVYTEFHRYNEREARELVELLNRLDRERDEAREDLEFRRGLYDAQSQYLDIARRERDEARDLLRRIATKGEFMNMEGQRLVVSDWLARRHIAPL